MTEHTLDELLQEQAWLVEFIETLVGVWESVPLLVWIIAAIVIVKLVSDWMTPNEYDQSTLPSDRRTRPDEREGPSRERYSIHDDLDVDRDYEIASESDPIEAPNKVDRGLVGGIRRLIRMLRGASRGQDD